MDLTTAGDARLVSGFVLGMFSIGVAIGLAYVLVEGVENILTKRRARLRVRKSLEQAPLARDLQAEPGGGGTTGAAASPPLPRTNGCLSSPSDREPKFLAQPGIRIVDGGGA